MKTETLYKKSREIHQNLRIEIIASVGTDWDMKIDDEQTKNELLEKLIRVSKKSCLSQGDILNVTLTHPLDIESTLSRLSQEVQLENTLIIFLTSSLDSKSLERCIPLARHNDILVLHLLHPIEITPEKYTSVLFEGRYIQIENYKKALAEMILSLNIIASKNNISYLEVSSEENPISFLNHYFKYGNSR